MCSISGIWRLAGKPVTEHEITAFNNVTSYRGPDGDGIYIDGEANLALGHRRLAILDLSAAGKQPMFSHDGNLAITFNGEIYNYIELKEELKAKGYAFHSNSDTEVILAAYQQWGEGCQLKFNGMWAFAIWNIKEQSLFLSRDRFGVKPLYYVSRPGELFAFASESVAFSELPGFKKTMSPLNLSRGISNAYYLEAIGETIYNEIVKLLPGHSLKLEKRGGAVIKKWWKIEEHLVAIPQTYEEQVQVFRDLFTDACKLRLRSDVPIGIALSGGLDSSAVYSTIQQINNQTINGNWRNAFVACFPGTKMDEKQYADEVINYTNGIPNYIYPEDGNIVESIYQETKSEDFVYTSPSVVHNIYKEMRNKNVVVSLDGHGADEMLYGYPDMIYQLMFVKNDLNQEDLHRTWAQMAGITAEKAQETITAENNREDRNPKLYYSLYHKYFPDSVKTLYRKQRFKSKRNESWLLNYFEMPKTYDNPPFDDASLNISYRQFHHKLPTLLRNWDRASMKHGVEIRMPFMDWRLLVYVFSLPQSAKVGEGYGKRIIRDAMKDWMPDSIRLRKNKIGINAPMEEWFNGRMATFILDAVNSPSFVKSDIWNGPRLQRLITGLVKEKKLTQKDCQFIWPYLNAWILSN